MKKTDKPNKNNPRLKKNNKKLSKVTYIKPYIVAIGASAGGLETLKVLFANSYPHPDIAFVIITHLSHTHISLLPQILSQFTSIKVSSIVDKQLIEGGHIYILPPNKNVYLQNGTLHLEDQKENEEAKLPIDFFLRSLASHEPQIQKGICIILSGMGQDGTMGLRALRERNGLIIVQSVESARFDSMPNSAINTGLVDYILPPDQMFDFLVKYLAHERDKSLPIEKSISDQIQQVLVLLHTHTGHDFVSYKINTIYRRIQKRMNILQLSSMATYLKYLRQNTVEIGILFKELLINVTNFFRDPEAFEILKMELESVLRNKANDYCFRIWIPGCATGDEVYSIAIILQECMERLKKYFNVQIFGTDIDEDAIEKARAGVYPLNIARDISDERLNKYFIREVNYYKINIEIRKMIIFAVQNVAKDPPFTKLDLLSCRNLLIYFNSGLQRKILPLFHYSLKPGGLLLLGTSETIGVAAELFNLKDRKWKLFERKQTSVASFQSVLDFPTSPLLHELDMKKQLDTTMQHNQQKLSSFLEHLLLEKYAPPCVVIDEKETLLYVYGRTAKYLEFTPGEVRLNILNIVRSELKAKLSTAIRKTLAQQKEVIFSGTQIKDGKDFKYINLRVKPIHDVDNNKQKLLLVIFEETDEHNDVNAKSGKNMKQKPDKKMVDLERELKYTKENLQTTIEELETSNEELKSSNEELQSTNEELQSTNEEIETSKEELQSLNEELTTVNTELENRVEQLSSANDDIKNLLDNTEIATIFLDKDLCIKRFTPKATEIINLIQSDVGRPISHIVSNLNYDKLLDDARNVLKTLESKSTEVMDKSGHWYVIRIIPYRTVTNLIDGVVVTFINIHEQKQTENELNKYKKDEHYIREYNNWILNHLSESTLLITEPDIVVGMSAKFKKRFDISKEDNTSSIFKFKIDWDKQTLKTLLDNFFVNQDKNIEKILEIDNKKITMNLQKITKNLTLLTFSE